MNYKIFFLFAAKLSLLAVPLAATAALADKASTAAVVVQVNYRAANVDGVEAFYREAGAKEDAPVLLLLQGFSTSSHMFRNLIPQLADKYHIVAPDYLGFGQISKEIFIHNAVQL